MNHLLDYAYTCRRGRKMEYNEDNFWCAGRFLPENNDGMTMVRTGNCEMNDCPFFAVFDGMGSEGKGREAAYMAASSFQEQYAALRTERKKNRPRTAKFLNDTCDRMNRQIGREAMKGADIVWMGTTAAILGFEKQKAIICNVGDSRIYQSRDADITLLTKDHITEDVEGDTGVLFQYIGADPREIEVNPFITASPVRKYDRFLICSDGLTDAVSEQEIGDALVLSENTADCARRLLRAALRLGGNDDITLIVCEVGRLPYGLF